MLYHYAHVTYVPRSKSVHTYVHTLYITYTYVHVSTYYIRSTLISVK